MNRAIRGDRYYIVRIDHRCTPAIVEYVSPDSARRWTSFQSSAELFGKRDAIREARRLARAPIWPGQYKAIGLSSRAVVYDSADNTVGI